MNVPYEPRQSQEPQEAEDFGETDNPQSSGCLIYLRIDTGLHNQENVVYRNGWDKIHHKPAFEILHLNPLGVKDNLRVVFHHNPRAEIENQVNEEEGIWDHVEDNPWGGVLILEEGDAYWNDDQISNHEEQHGEVPIEPRGQDRDMGQTERRHQWDLRPEEGTNFVHKLDKWQQVNT